MGQFTWESKLLFLGTENVLLKMTRTSKLNEAFPVRKVFCFSIIRGQVYPSEKWWYNSRWFSGDPSEKPLRLPISFFIVITIIHYNKFHSNSTLQLTHSHHNGPRLPNQPVSDQLSLYLAALLFYLTEAPAQASQASMVWFIHWKRKRMKYMRTY